jgi:hypothetical protein
MQMLIELTSGDMHEEEIGDELVLGENGSLEA